jgi:lambda repressor-like predicted transcriptional regulator
MNTPCVPSSSLRLGASSPAEADASQYALPNVASRYDVDEVSAPALTPYGELLEQAPKVNRQLWQNAPESLSEKEKDWRGSPDVLHQALAPNLSIIHEQPLHRAIVMLKASGLSNNEIAARTGYTYPWISQVLRQPWARERLIAELNAAGREGIQQLLNGTVVDSVLKLVEIRDTANAKASDKIAASRELLNRALGMPTQHIDQTTSNAATPRELAEIERELSALANEEKRLTGN